MEDYVCQDVENIISDYSRNEKFDAVMRNLEEEYQRHQNYNADARVQMNVFHNLHFSQIYGLKQQYKKFDIKNWDIFHQRSRGDNGLEWVDLGVKYRLSVIYGKKCEREKKGFYWFSTKEYPFRNEE